MCFQTEYYMTSLIDGENRCICIIYMYMLLCTMMGLARDELIIEQYKNTKDMRT